MMRIVVTALVCCVIAGSPLVHAQTVDEDTRFRLAQGLEHSGEYERAVSLYEGLYKNHPDNYIYFEGLQRMFVQLKRYDDAIALIQSRLSTSPDDVNLLALLGTALYKEGKESDATASWERALTVQPANSAVYRLVANVLIENRLLEKASEVYRRGRVACNDPNLFTIEIAQISIATMDYRTATEEFLRWMLQNPSQLVFVQGRLATITGREDGRNAAIDVVRKSLEKSENPRLYELLEWLMLEGRKFADAYEISCRIDQLTEAHGSAILAFADRAFNGRAYDVAARAYQRAVDVPLPKEKMPMAKYGYARSLQEAGIMMDSTATGALPSGKPVPEVVPRFGGAIAEYRKIIAEYPRSEFAARAFFQIGEMQFSRFFDLDAALTSYKSAADESSLSSLRWDAKLRAGGVCLAKGDTLQARDYFLAVGAAPDATQDQTDEASFRLAELEYFAGRDTLAAQRLDALVVNLKADYANDALQLQGFLQENALTAPAALAEYGAADLIARQHRYEEAIQRYDAIIKKYPQALLVDDALLMIAGLQEASGRAQEAVATYEKILKDFKETSSVLDKAWYRLGLAYEVRLHDPAHALTAYEKLLADHPGSVLVADARRRIRILRGENVGAPDEGKGDQRP
jgi:cellulose synthase operon protein C